MNNTNYVTSIVKILENPNKTIFNKNIIVLKIRAQLPQFRNTKIVNLIFWGNLANDIVKYYQRNDYILIEGYLSLNKKRRLTILEKDSKKIEITVSKVYPFLLSQNRQFIKKE
jgi:hypothetical protein